MSQQNRQSVPPYSEEEVTHWLAFLARGMTEHGQTIFLMEKLQPSWLYARGQRWIYIFASRMLWGILSGLIFGLVVGLIFGLIDIIRLSRHHQSHRRDELRSRQISWNIFLIILISGLSGGLIIGLRGDLWSLLFWLSIASPFFLIFGLIWVFRSLTSNSRKLGVV